MPLDGVVFSRLIENNGLAVNRVPDRISRMGSQIAGILGVRKFWLVGFKLERFAIKKSCYRKNCSAVDLIFTSRITFPFEITIERLYVRYMHKQKVTKLMPTRTS